ncbi:unnamed protein product [Auanema sp. JU1783]|nr:unnamed protein product [Auanema sp. JU1783]
MDSSVDVPNTRFSPDGEETHREAAEVFIHMHRNFRVSRNLRAQWFFDHLGKTVSIQDEPTGDEYGREMTVLGIISKDGSVDEFVGNEVFRVCLDTKVTFLSRYYRQVFILDLSPSTIVADEQSNSCLHHKLLECLQLSLSSVVRSFTIPGTRKKFRPQVYVSIIVFVPFLSFSEKSVLVHGDLLTESNVFNVLEKARVKFDELLKSLHSFSQPILRTWVNLQRHHRIRIDEIPPRKNSNQETEDFMAMNAVGKNLNGTARQPPNSNLNDRKQDIWYYDDQSLLPAKFLKTNNGYTFPESAILFILRLGLITMQSLPEHTQSNIVVITDGVAGIPDTLALEDLLNQIRNQTVSCSFIQVQGTSHSEACFGHVSSGELFHFLAMATFGSYLPYCRCSGFGLESIEDGEEEDEAFYRELNSFHRSLLCWSFQNFLEDNVHISNLLKEISTGFAEFQKCDSVVYPVFKGTYHSKLHEMLYVRLREGFSMKRVEYLKHDSRIKIHLSMPFRPLVFVEYTIIAGWPTSVHNREAITTEIFIRGPKPELKDFAELNRSEMSSSEERKRFICSLKSTIKSIQEADELMMHIHSFNCDKAYFNLPAGIGSRAIFHIDDPTSIGQRYDTEDDFGKFLNYWKVLCNIDDGVWQKWVHMHFERVILQSKELPSNVFKLPVNIDCGPSKTALYGLLKDVSSFCLLRDKLYVTFVRGDGNDKPTYFYMIRISHEPPCLILKTAFPGGVNSCERTNVVEEIRGKLKNLKIGGSSSRSAEPALTVFRRPLERILIRYGHVPVNMEEIVRVSPEETDEPNEVAAYNTISKYLYCKRRIWKLFPFKASSNREEFNATYILNLILTKRRHEGFKTAWTKNGMVSVCRQVFFPCGPALEQFIIFPPSLRLPNQRSSRLLAASPRAWNDDKISSRSLGRPADNIILTSEAWIEPSAEYETKGPKEPAPHVDDDLIALLFSIDQLLRMCDFPSGNSRPSSHDAADDREEEAETSNSRSVSIVHQSVRFAKLALNSNRVLIHVPTFETDADFKPKRMKTFFNCLTRELDSLFTVSVDMEDPAIFSKVYDDVVKHSLENRPEHFPNTKCRVYMKKLSPWSVLQLFVPQLPENPKREEWINWDDLPVIASVCDEPQLAYGLVTGKPLGSVRELDCGKEEYFPPASWEKEKIYDVPESLILHSRCSNHARQTYSAIELIEVVKFVYFNVVERALVAAVHACFCRGISVTPSIVQSVLNEQCKCESYEVESVSSALEAFCGHLNESNKEKNNYCCEESNLSSLFKESLGRNFHQVPGIQNYFFYQAQKGDSLSETRRGSLRVDYSNIEDEKDKTETVDDDSGSNVGSLRTRSRIEEFTKYVDDQGVDDCIDISSSRRNRRKQDTPVFVVFHCALHFKDGPMDCFPISFIPSCIHNLLKQSRCLPQNYDIKDITVKMLLYVLTWPSQKQFKRDGSSSDSSENDSVEGFVGLSCDRSAQFLKNMPNKERTAIRQLLDGMNRLLELESILIDSRKEKITMEKLKRISNFISEETSKTGDHGRISEKWCSLSLVESSEEIKETLMERLDGYKINYCRLKRLNNTNYFYICKVENIEEFGQSLPMAEKEGELRGTAEIDASAEVEKDSTNKHSNSFKRTAYRCTSQRISENMRVLRSTDGGDVSLLNISDRKDLLADFWVILIIDETVSVKFCQRYKTQHSEIFDATWTTFRDVIRTINQERLLAKMYELRECDPLLLCPEDFVSSSLSESDGSEDDDKLPTESRVFETDRTAFPPGYFACPLQKLYWFNVHSRLKLNGSSFDSASELMQTVIRTLAVKNVPNTYVIRETNGNVLYMHLYTSKTQFETDAQNNKFCNHSSKKFLKEVDQMIGSRILLAVHGITQPSEDFNNSIIASIQARFDEEVLNVLINEFQKTDSNVIFDKDDVMFVQRAPQEPSAVFRFPIPIDMRDFLEDLYYYTQQHLQIPMSVARCKENVNFVPYSNNYSAQSQTFFVYVKTPNEDNEMNKKRGVACLELRFVDSDGQSLLLTPGVLREHSHTLLVKTFNSDKDRLAFYKTITNSTDRQPFTSSLVMQVFVWQRGDVVLEDLKLILRRVLERACCDVVTEFGILNLKIIETSSILGCSSADLLPQSPHSNPGYRSQLGSSKASPVPSDKRPSLRKRDSSETLPCGTQPTTPSHTLDSSRKAGSTVFSFDTTRRGSIASEVGGSMESMIPTQKFLNAKLVSSIVNFFDFVIAKEIENKSSMVSVHSYTWEFDCQNTLRKALSEICDKLKGSLQNEDVDLSDKIYFCERVANSTGPDRYSVKQEKDWKIVPQFTQDQGTLMNEKPKTDYIILATVEKVAQETLRYGYEITKTALPAVLEKVANDSNTCNMFSPGFNPFVPRQRLLYGIARGESLTVYFYNYNPDKIRDLLNFINRATLWHLARSRLSREISLHKLGITHLSPVQKSSENPYLSLVWRSTAKLIELEYPADELNAVAIEGLPELIADLVLRPIRKADFSFVPNYQSQCLIKNQLDQVLSLRSDLERRMHRFITLSQVHARLRKDECEVKESELAALLECSRRVHFVQTPVLLFPKWRRKIAEIRATIEPKTPKKENSSRPPTGSSSSTSRRLRSSTLSVSSSAQHQQQSPLRFKSEHEDPFEVKILYMLLNDYISYLKSIGLKPFRVTNLSEKSQRMDWYQTEYPQGCKYAPTVTLFKETCGGIVVIKLSFLQPYFILSIHVYSSSDLIQPNRNINDSEARSRWRKLEELKDSILSKCHVHSFTYDFHLRILSKYLVGKDQVLFSNGYNTYSFLVDFLKYYGCRPPNARNCVYEVRPTFELKHGVAAKDIWTHFLDMHYEKHYGWTVVRLKNSEDDVSSKAHDFMLVSSEKPRNLNGHEKLRVLLRDRRKEGKAGQLHLVQYLVLVDGTHISPMEDEVHREEYDQDDVGEFLHVEGPSEAEKEAEIDMLIGIISEGGLPLVDGSVNRKRRFSSGGLEKAATQIRGSGSNNRLETDLSYSPIRNGPKADSDSDMPSRLSVEGSSTRRHRKTIDSEDVEMPGEKVIYVQFLCAKQRNLQMILEEAVMDYTKLLDDAVLEAEWKCRRDNIWSKILVPKKALAQTSAFKSLLPSKNPQTDVWGILMAYSHDLPADEFETLLEYVHQIDMSDREKRLISLLQGTNCARLCRFLFARYGSDRCRFLEYPPPSTKKCLLITNPNNPNYTLFLISCSSETTPELSVLLKDNYLNDTLDDDTRRYHEKLLDQAFDELVQCVTASLWADLLLRPPGRA